MNYLLEAALAAEILAQNSLRQNIIIPSDILEQQKHLPPTYKKAFQSMLEEYNNTLNFLQKYKILQNFGIKFVLLSQIWKIYQYLESYLHSVHIDSAIPDSSYRKILRFCSKIYDESDERLILRNENEELLRHIRCKYWHNILYQPERILCIPHWDSTSTLKNLEANCPKPLPKTTIKKYERVEFLYQQFLRDDLSTDEWLLYLNEIKDNEIIVGLFEHRLGWKRGCLSKNLWKNYLNFLKEKDQIAYLNIFRRYTRFFVEDNEMVEQYRNEIKRISEVPLPVSEFWIDTILFEFDFGTEETASKILQRALASLNQSYDNIQIQHFPALPKEYFDILQNIESTIKYESKNVIKEYTVPQKSPISCYFPKNEIEALKKTQNFSFSQTLIFYITQNIIKSKNQHKILQKLFNTCKYFFAIQPTPICHRLVLGWPETSKYIDQSLFLSDNDLDFSGLDNLYIATTLDVITKQRNTLSKTIPRIFKCDAKHGKILNQDFTVDDLKKIYDCLYPKGDIIPSSSNNIIYEGGKEQYDFELLDVYLQKI